MGKNIVEKILSDHILEGKPEQGQEVGIKIDQTLTQDATGTMAYLQFEAMGVPRVQTELSVSYVDHNTVQIGFENADDHKYLQSVAAKYGIVYSRAGNGICHQVQLERFGKPGKTLLGSDSHTPTGGGVGMMAIGAGGLDVAVAMAGGAFFLPYPKVVKINLTGELQPWVAAKDVILKVLEKFTTKGNVGCIFEYGGPGVKTLSVPERATITNMGAECGVTTSIFPSDEITRKFLKAQDREEDWTELIADEDAKYDQVVEINLSELVPMAATPHSPGNISTVKEIGEIDVDQVCIGSCTNSSYTDMMTVAEILKGKKLHPNTSFVVAPGSKQVIENIMQDGGFASIVSAGARIAESACGFCIGNSQSPKTDAVSLRTSNRNFLGRSGTKSANAYLVSPETAAAAVITGKFTDPRDLEKMGIEYPNVKMPEKFYIDDSMFIFPQDAEVTEIYRGPNIGDPPAAKPLQDKIGGVVTLKVEDKITTDHIIPAGSKMKFRSNVPKYSEFLFEVVDPTFHDRAEEIRDSGKDNIIVAGLSYGQGSSREHAALCPMYMGVKAVLAKSMERIHNANLINFGILPLNFVDEADYDKIDQADELEISNIKEALKEGKNLIVKNITKGIEIAANYALSDRQKEILLAGGTLAMMKK
ncbi:MAG: aconitate hydratase [Candidatus Cloacimonetes bacterium]|nr:aconitate hydratase [Candidatus Cloacimonadota bacterium]MCF7815104.1 aconitate hydratase [Candidatus Cloacimonadota bacterium]MCF7868051.1 aconitate hydratase [Candidatus Cloacimonadota bacterium]MCF7883971.1 aconitate hydratase [Candidatus Cloacimonadota bacterium]